MKEKTMLLKARSDINTCICLEKGVCGQEVVKRFTSIEEVGRRETIQKTSSFMYEKRISRMHPINQSVYTSGVKAESSLIVSMWSAANRLTAWFTMSVHTVFRR